MKHPLLESFDALRRSEPRLAMATLVSATGASSGVVGAKTFIGTSGRITGAVTIGGCLDARAAEAGDRVLASGRVEVLDVALSDEQAWDLGLTCGGDVRLLVEPVDAADAGDPVVAAYVAARRAVDGGHRALVVRALTGASTRLMTIDDTGARVGSLGDRERDARVAEIAAGAAVVPGVVVDAAEGTSYFVEAFAPPTVVAIFGAGEVAVVLSRVVRELDMHPVIVDPRSRYATRARFPDPAELRIADPGVAAAELATGSDTHVVIVFHDYKFELPVLRSVLRTPVRYIGLLSSRKRGAALREMLAGEGYTPAELERIRTPVGLDIGARTPAQVAVAIAAELVAVRAGRPVAARAR